MFVDVPIYMCSGAWHSAGRVRRGTVKAVLMAISCGDLCPCFIFVWVVYLRHVPNIPMGMRTVGTRSLLCC